MQTIKDICRKMAEINIQLKKRTDEYISIEENSYYADAFYEDKEKLLQELKEEIVELMVERLELKRELENRR